MKYYLKADGSRWAFELDGSQDDLITDDMRPMTAEEIDALFNPSPPVVEQIDPVTKLKNFLADNPDVAGLLN